MPSRRTSAKQLLGLAGCCDDCTTMTRALRRGIERVARSIDVQALSAEAAFTLLTAGLVQLDQMNVRQLEEIAGGGEWDLRSLTDTELARVASGEVVLSRRLCRRKRPG